MIDQFKEAKNNKKVILFKNFQKVDITWEDALQFIFDECSIENKNLIEKVNKKLPGVDCIGNVQIQEKFWLAPQTSYLFDRFNGVAELLKRVNGDKENKECERYKIGVCTCDLVWHMQGLRMSLSPRYVSDHNDPWDILYWQVLGTSFWKINNDEVYELNPGDMLYFNQEDSHAVWCEGPRAGFIIDGVGLLEK